MSQYEPIKDAEYSLNLSATNSKESALIIHKNSGGARGVIVSVAGYRQGDTSSNPGPDWLYFT